MKSPLYTEQSLFSDCILHLLDLPKMEFDFDAMEIEEEVMMELEGVYEEEMQGDLLDRLVAEAPMAMSGSSNYSYRPAPFQAMSIEL